LDKALDAFNKAIELDSTVANNYIIRGNAYDSLGNHN